MPRYVILEHDHLVLHWDFMLEAGELLRTWRLAAQPDPDRTILAEPLGDHRRLYLDYEGPVSGGRGCVTRWDAGTFVWVAGEAERVVVQLAGGRCHGTALLQRAGTGKWQFTLRSAD